MKEHVYQKIKRREMYSKRIILFMALLICCHSAIAQRRVCDMEAFCISPSGKVANGSSLRLSYGYINRGPDVKYSEDTTLVWLYMIVDGEERPVYNGVITGNPGRIVDVGETSTYADNYGIKFSFPDATDTVIVDFCVVVGSGGVNQDGDTVRPFTYDDPNWDNNKSCNKIMVLPQKSTAISNIPEEHNSLIVYPNPATNILYINTESTTSGTQQATIRDMTGRIVLERHFEPTYLNNSVLSLNIEQLPAGMYSIMLQSGENIMVEKLIITR